MLGGEYRHSLDAKNRIFVPAKFREELGSPLVVSIALRDKCLKIYSAEGWEKYTSAIDDKERKLSEVALRFLNSTMTQAVPDKQGRIILTSELLSYANIKNNVVVVGCGRYAEIWSDEIYDEVKKKLDVAALIAELERFGL